MDATRLGLRKAVVERNCPELSDEIVAQFKGGYPDGAKTIAALLKLDRSERNIRNTVLQLKRILADEYKDSEERRKFMDGLYAWKGFNDFEAEAVRHVYRELYGKLPKLKHIDKKTDWFPEYP